MSRAPTATLLCLCLWPHMTAVSGSCHHTYLPWRTVPLSQTNHSLYLLLLLGVWFWQLTQSSNYTCWYSDTWLTLPLSTAIKEMVNWGSQTVMLTKCGLFSLVWYLVPNCHTSTKQHIEGLRDSGNGSEIGNFLLIVCFWWATSSKVNIWEVKGNLLLFMASHAWDIVICVFTHFLTHWSEQCQDSIISSLNVSCMETSVHSWTPTMERMPEQARSCWKRVCFWFSFCFEEADILHFLDGAKSNLTSGFG